MEFDININSHEPCKVKGENFLVNMLLKLEASTSIQLIIWNQCAVQKVVAYLESQINHNCICNSTRFAPDSQFRKIIYFISSIELHEINFNLD